VVAAFIKKISKKINIICIFGLFYFLPSKLMRDINLGESYENISDSIMLFGIGRWFNRLSYRERRGARHF
jgi:hypothetical protein